MRNVMMSGHCATPQTANPSESHERCARNGGGSYGNPQREFVPCPCPCHYPEERYECECGNLLAEAPLWPDETGEGEIVYTHIDPTTGRATGFECPTTKSVSRNDPEPEIEEEVEEEPEPVVVGGKTPKYHDPELDEFDALMAELDEEF